MPQRTHLCKKVPLETICSITDFSDGCATVCVTVDVWTTVVVTVCVAVAVVVTLSVTVETWVIVVDKVFVAPPPPRR
ncbi:MAG: hypothetical protein ABWU84_12315 [Pyrobaculum sp.]|uniref:hypothetical protein n=1 Tax=Pyrobaculum sp. TaxID=2004705 RepID=UPI003EEE434A